MGYGHTTLRTVFPVTVVSPSTPRTNRYYDAAEARTGERILGIDRAASKSVKTAKVATVKAVKIPTMDRPKYETESAVTLAIVTNEIPFLERLRAYDLAKEWQKYLKLTEKKKFFPTKTARALAPVAVNWRPGYATPAVGK